jgi:hypothetical protein
MVIKYLKLLFSRSKDAINFFVEAGYYTKFVMFQIDFLIGMQIIILQLNPSLIDSKISCSCFEWKAENS